MTKRTPATPELVIAIRAAARVDSHSFDAYYAAILETRSRESGYGTWRELWNAVAASMWGQWPRDDLPVDPVLPERFDDRRNEGRSEGELAEWWDRPFAVTLPDGRLSVRCLDGGAWDRSTGYGVAPNLDAAKALAREKHSAWLKLRTKPTALIDDGKVLVALQPQHPHDGFYILKECSNTEEAGAYIRFLEAN